MKIYFLAVHVVFLIFDKVFMKRKKPRATQINEQLAPIKNVNQAGGRPTIFSARKSGGRYRQMSGRLAVLLGFGLVAAVFYSCFIYYRVHSFSRQCFEAGAAQDWPKMEQVAKEWARWQPSAAAPWLKAAEAAARQGNLLRTAEYLTQLPDSAPVEAFHELSRIQLEMLSQPESAAQTCRRTLIAYPADFESHQRLFAYYAMTCQRSKLITEARRAINVGSANLVTFAYYAAANWLTLAAGHDFNQRMLRNDPDNELFTVASLIHLLANPELIPKSESAVPMEQYEAMITNMLQRFPKNIELLASRGRFLCQRGALDDLAKLLADIPEQASNDCRFWRLKGWYHSAREQWSEARIAYEHALELWPMDWISQHELAIVLRRADTLDNAGKMQRRADLGKEVMRNILSAPRLDASNRGVFEKIVAYMEECGEREMAKSLSHLLDSPK